jgi:hypothetical protein
MQWEKQTQYGQDYCGKAESKQHRSSPGMTLSERENWKLSVARSGKQKD